MCSQQLFSFLFLLIYYSFGDRILPCNLGWPSAQCMAQDGLELLSVFRKKEMVFIQHYRVWLHTIVGPGPGASLVLTLCQVLGSICRGPRILCSAGADPHPQGLCCRGPQPSRLYMKRFTCLEGVSNCGIFSFVFTLFLFQ